MKLYHYTCSHRVAGIRRDGVLRPNPQVVLGGIELIWLTDLAEPLRKPLGLTSYTLRCDRTEYRVTIDDEEPERWLIFARRSVPRWQREPLEAADGAMPMHWWVSEVSIPVLSVEAVSP